MENPGLDTTAPVRPGDEVDAAALGEALASRLDGWSPDVAVEQFPSGHSNLTYLVRSGEREVVVRMPPRGYKAIAAGHDMRREYRILSALHPAFGRVPRPLLFCDEADTLLGKPFYAMERVRGVILRDAASSGRELSGAELRPISRALVETLAALHAVDVDAAGIGDLGRPDGYVARQVRGWTDRYARARTDEIADVELVAAWLAENLPDHEGAALIHNDFKYDNVVLDPADLTRVVAVLDWEMATIGDPRADLGTSLAYWIEPDDADDLRRLGFVLSARPGNMTRQEVVAEYAARTGRDVDGMLFFYVLGLFKVAVIAQQIYGRFRAGLTRDPRFAAMIGAVRALSGAGRRAVERGTIGSQ
jgi:aminoglycoside phosphotransferase (APT) family kinase protein